jgi:4'-phosphopantetheinyl transferase
MSRVNIDISFNETILWKKASNSDFHIGENIDVWLVKVSEHLSLLRTYSAFLQADEIARANRYLRKEDHDRFIISRAALRLILSKYTGQQAEAIKFALEPNRKPYMPGSNIQYNLSDSGDQVLIAISRHPVGVDVEYIKPTFYYDTILPLNFNQAEVDFINEADSSHRFFILWTRKEAILKATGIGLTDHLKQVPSLDGFHKMDGGLIATKNDWNLLSFMTNEDHMATLAVNPSTVVHNFYGFNPDEFSF